MFVQGDGDFVLVRKQEVAQNHDIVIAQVVEGDLPTSTVKRYIHHGDTLELRPESSESTHQVYFLKENEYSTCYPWDCSRSVQANYHPVGNIQFSNDKHSDCNRWNPV